MEKEIWKDVVGYEGKYRVSNFGNILSVGRKIYFNNRITGNRQVRNSKDRILKNCLDRNGYLHVTLLNESIQKTIKIHKLVAIAFLGHKPCGHKLVVDHIDGNKLNNEVDNLQIITNRDNISKSDIERTSKYTGVSWHKATRKWISQIKLSGKTCYLGIYDCEHKAHLAYMNKLSEIK